MKFRVSKKRNAYTTLYKLLCHIFMAEVPTEGWNESMYGLWKNVHNIKFEKTNELEITMKRGGIQTFPILA